jgi:hypothetical protein
MAAFSPFTLLPTPLTSNNMVAFQYLAIPEMSGQCVLGCKRQDSMNCLLVHLELEHTL